MSPYVESGYIVVLGGLGTYAVILLGRERQAVARLRRSGVVVCRRATVPKHENPRIVRREDHAEDDGD